MKFEKENIYRCDKDIIVNKHLWFKQGDKCCCTRDGAITGCDHLEHSEESLKDYLNNFTNITIEQKLSDKVNHPSHYTWLKDKCGIEVIDITRHMDFDLGNALKYILRCGLKAEQGYSTKEKTIEDLKKAIFYINDKIKMLN